MTRVSVEAFRSTLTNSQWDAARELWRRGKDAHDIAKHFGVNESVIYIRLDFPPHQLNPNKRLHWSKVASYKRTYKAIWCAQLQPHKAALKGKTQFNISFIPPDKRIRDVDNIVAACKTLCDSLSLVCGVDDSKFRIMWPREFLPAEKGGFVLIEVIA
jgi:crossover junction endodeoxyribonuclease RusA